MVPETQSPQRRDRRASVPPSGLCVLRELCVEKNLRRRDTRPRTETAPNASTPKARLLSQELRHRGCAHHPERMGYALCMSCQSVLCHECATEWDGINYCARCLTRRRLSAQGSSSVLGWVGIVTAALCLLYLNARLMVWFGVFLAGLP